MRADGHSDFNALRSRQGAAQAVLIGFDLLHHGDQDLRRNALEGRREQLADLIGDHPTCPSPRLWRAMAR